MDANLLAVVALIVVALIFDYINGFHDAANSIATVVSTRVLSPGKAVVWAAFFNFVAAFTFGTAVAKTVGAGLVDLDVVTFAVIFAGADRRDRLEPDHLVLRPADQLVARADRRLRRRGGRQGGLRRDHRVGLDQDADLHRAGAADRHGARASRSWSRSCWIFRGTSPGRVDRWFRRLQLVSAAAYSLGHGGNDAQKTMGIIAGVLVAGGYLNLVDGELPIPFWVILAAHAAIALGTLSGGWRIIHTMGSKITKLQPVGGFAAETAGAISLFTATHLGVPVSTTHTITGAIVGVGAIKRLSAVRWGVAGQIVWAWILTIPAAAIIAAVTYWIVAATIALVGALVGSVRAGAR